jgi:hypothetical protein
MRAAAAFATAPRHANDRDDHNNNAAADDGGERDRGGAMAAVVEQHPSDRPARADGDELESASANGGEHGAPSLAQPREAAEDEAPS